MGISYNPLWEMLKEKGISKMEFAKMSKYQTQH